RPSPLSTTRWRVSCGASPTRTGCAGRPTSGGRTCGPQVAPPSRSRTGTGQWWTTALVCRRRTRLGAGLLKPARSGCQSPARQGVAVRLRGGPAAAGRASRGRRWPRRRRRRGERGAATGSRLPLGADRDLKERRADEVGVLGGGRPHAGQHSLGGVPGRGGECGEDGLGAVVLSDLPVVAAGGGGVAEGGGEGVDAGECGLGRVELFVEGVEGVVGDGVDGVAAGHAASL